MPDRSAEPALVDLFGGLGGWEVAAIALGLRPLGIEWDDAACATRRAAGLWTLQADVAALDPHQVVFEHFGRTLVKSGRDGLLDGLIASPPCQAFSMAGKGLGRAAIGVYGEAIARWAEGKSFDRAELDEACGDERAHLVLEPLRWAYALRPRWVALEQVEPVLPLWEAMASALRATGYHAWTGTLSAEQYGVPQTRRRAILLASLDGSLGRPVPTHQRYLPPRRREEATLGLFDVDVEVGGPERLVHPDDRGLLPWVSMAEALGWGMTERPGMTFAPGTASGGPSLDGGGSGARRVVSNERAAGRWQLRGNARANATVRGVDEPAPTITGSRDHEDRQWIVDTGNTRGGSRPEGRARSAGDPAPVMTSRADQMEWRPERYDARGQKDGRTKKPNRMRSVDEPAPTIAVESRNDSWTSGRPATTVNGDPRISEPGHHDSNVSGSQQANAIRVSVEEALVLQSFPADYPVQGGKGKAFEQVGNAIPPLLAWHVLCAALTPSR